MSGKPWYNFASRKESMLPADGEFEHVSVCACLMSIFPLRSSFNHLSFYFSHMQRPDGTSNAVKLERGQTNAAIQMRRGKKVCKTSTKESDRIKEVLTYMR